MKVFTLKNCTSAILSAGCLIFIATIIVIFIIVRNYNNKKPLFYFNNKLNIEKPIDNIYKDTQNTKLNSNNKQVLIKVGLIADTENYWDNTNKAIDYLENQDIKFIIHLGDVTILGVPEDLKTAKELFNKSSVKIYPVPGDRDLWKSRQTQNGLAAFNSVFGNSYGVVEENGIKFLLLDNANIYEGINDDQWKFIHENIDTSNFVFFHNPIFFKDNFLFGDKGMGQYDEEVDKQRQELLALIRKSPVKAVFAGNQHLFSETVDSEDTDLFHYVIGSLNSERNLELPNFSILTIYDDGDYYIEKIVL